MGAPDEASDPPLVPVGRLDKDSSGLLLLTDQESVIGQLLRPGEHGSRLSKIYRVTTRRRVPDKVLQLLEAGVDISIRNWSRKDKSVRTLPCRVERIQDCLLEFELREGKNRQIRKMLGRFGFAVGALHRTHFGPISIDGLVEGEISPLSDVHVASLLA